MSTTTLTSPAMELQDMASNNSAQAHEDRALRPQAIQTSANVLNNSRANIVITILTLALFVNSVSTGLITVGIPRIASDLDLSEGRSRYTGAYPAHDKQFSESTDDMAARCSRLTSGSCLLLAGSIADVIGSRIVNLTGTFLLGVFILACGLPNTGIQLIMFRAMQGIAIALCLPTSMGILSTAVASGTRRNIAFSCLGIGQVLGFAIGLVLSGVFVDTIGWRAAFYISGSITLILFLVSVWALPPDKLSEKPTLKRLARDIDWIGAAIASTCMTLFSYVLAMITSDIAHIRQAVNAAFLGVSLALVPAFIFWVGRQERLRKPALIPNFIWKNKAFTTICLMVLLSFAVMQTMELFVSLFFQNVQHLSALESSIRFLPSIVVGVALELTTGLFVHRLPVLYLLLISSLLSAGAPLLMALINVKWPYWYDAFFAQILSYFSVDVLFTVGILVISDVFPERDQALAGAIFNTLAQFGTSIGLAVMGVISNSVTARYKGLSSKTSPEALEAGYRATFWAAFAFMIVTCCIGAFGLGKIGKVGVKRD